MLGQIFGLTCGSIEQEAHSSLYMSHTLVDSDDVSVNVCVNECVCKCGQDFTLGSSDCWLDVDGS